LKTPLKKTSKKLVINCPSQEYNVR